MTGLSTSQRSASGCCDGSPDVRLVVERIVVKPGSPGSHIWNGHRFNPDDVVIEWVEARGQDVIAELQALVRGAAQTRALYQHQQCLAA